MAVATLRGCRPPARACARARAVRVDVAHRVDGGADDDSDDDDDDGAQR